MCYSMSRYTNLAHGYQHNCTGFELMDFSPMETRIPRDVYMDQQGVPYEIGFAHLMNFDYQSGTTHPSADAGISSLTYELALILCQLKSYISCHSDLCHYYIKNADLSSCYESIDSVLVPLALKNSKFLHLNDSYESIIRFLCGAGQHNMVEMQAIFALVCGHFQAFMSRKDNQPDVASDSNIGDDSQTFRVHRLVIV